jgi:hypothetical protein
MAKRLSHGQHADGVNGAVVGAPPMLTNRFLAAIALATEIHGHERRMGTEIPYLAASAGREATDLTIDQLVGLIERRPRPPSSGASLLRDSPPTRKRHVRAGSLEGLQHER